MKSGQIKTAYIRITRIKTYMKTSYTRKAYTEETSYTRKAYIEA